MTDTATTTESLPLPTESWAGKTPNAEQLAEILRLHADYTSQRKGGVRAYLSGAVLSDANLSYANLSDAYRA